MNITLAPHIPMALWLLLAVLAAALVAAYAAASRRRLAWRRRAAVVTCMSASLALPLIMLLNPMWVEPIPPPEGKPRLTVLLDSSASMATADVAGRSRYEAAVELAGDTARRLARDFDVRFAAFSTPAAAANIDQFAGVEPADAATNLGAAIEGAIEDRPQGQAIWLLSDGIHNGDGGAAAVRRSADRAKALSAPVFATTIGGAAEVRDIEVALSAPQEMAFVDQEVTVVVSVRERGSLAGSANLSLILDDEVLERRTVELAPGGVAETTVRVRQNESGLYRYVFAVEPIAGEVTSVNNRATFVLRVVDEPVRVLLLEGRPYWDTKFFARTLSIDRSIELTSVVRIGEGRYLWKQISEASATGDDADATARAATRAGRTEQTQIRQDAAAWLADRDALAPFGIIVLGRDTEVYLTDAALVQIKRWLIENEGSLVCFRGAPSSQLSQRLAELMPVRWSPTPESRFRVQLTESGESLRWFSSMDASDQSLALLPSLATTARSDSTKPLAVVLATVADSENQVPVITYQPMGAGRVVVVEGAGMWRWAFLPPEHQRYGDAYGILWRSLVRWLVSNVGLLPSQDMALRSDKVTFSTTEFATCTLLRRDSSGEPPEVELSGDALDAPQRFRPTPAGTAIGQYRVAFGKLPEGQYEAHVVAPSESAGAEAPDVTDALEDGGLHAAIRTTFDVRGNLRERLDVAARADMMKLVADRSGGAVVAAADASDLSRLATNRVAAALPQRYIRTTAWDRAWVLALVFALWAATWGLRRWSGLV